MPELNLAESVDALKSGLVIAYPTEAVYGLGCDPWNHAAVDRIRLLKQRPSDQGLIIIASKLSEVRDWINADELTLKRASETWPGPVTWIFAAAQAPPWVCHGDGSIAIRVTAHAGCVALIQAFGAPIVSTSANPSGEKPAVTLAEVRRYFQTRVEVVRGRLGDAGRPSEIRDGRQAGTVIRKG